MAFFKPPIKTTNVTTDAATLNGKSEGQLSVSSASTASNADKLDNIDSTGFATSGHNHDLTYLGIESTATNSNKLEGYAASDFATSGHIHVGGGDVSGPSASTDECIVLFDGINGKLLKDSVVHISDFATSGHIHNDIQIIDTSFATTFSANTIETTNNYGGTVLEMRCVIPATSIITSGNIIKLTVKAPTTQALVFNSVYIVERDGSTPNGTTVPTQVTFSNYMSGENIWITQGVTAESDYIEFEFDETKDYLVIMHSSGLYAAMEADGYTYYSTTLADPDAKDMLDPSPQTMAKIVSISTISTYTRHKLDFKTTSLYELDGTLTINGEELLTGAIDGTTSASFKIAKDTEYGPQFIYTDGGISTLKLINVRSFKLSENNGNTSYAMYTGSNFIGMLGSSSYNTTAFSIDDYMEDGYAYFDHRFGNSSVKSYEEWYHEGITYEKYCNAGIVYDLYTKGGVSNRGLQLTFATDAVPVVEIYSSETDCATITPSSITLSGNTVPKYYGFATTAPETNIVAGDEYWNTGDSKFYKYNGATWIALN